MGNKYKWHFSVIRISPRVFRLAVTVVTFGWSTDIVFSLVKWDLFITIEKIYNNE